MILTNGGRATRPDVSHRNPYQNKLRHGFTLTEMAIVLSIIGLVFGGIWAAASSAYNAMEMNQAHQEVDTIMLNMRQMYAGIPSFPAGDLTSAAITAGVFPSNFISGSYVGNPWSAMGVASYSSLSGGVSIGSQVGWGGCPLSADNLQIVFWGLPYQAIRTLLSNYLGPSAGDVTCVYADCTGTITSPQTATYADITSCGTSSLNPAAIANVVLSIQK